MRRFLFFTVLLLLVMPLSAQQDPVPTLVPPTPVPSTDLGGEEVLRTQSSIARLLDGDGRVRIGVLYNEPPFGQLTERGDVVGFDVDLAKAIGEVWGIEVRLRQVTRQTAKEMMDAGQVDMLIAAQIHRRDLDDEYEFSQTYHLGSQSMMVRADDAATTLGEMTNRRVGVVVGTPSERAVAEYQSRSGVTFNVQTYLSIDRMYGALGAGEVDGIVASRHHLTRVAIQPETIRILEEPIELEPYAIALPRQDVVLRNLVNQTLQYLRRSGKLDEIRAAYFPDAPKSKLAVWAGLSEDAPKPANFSPEIVYPTQYIVPKLQTTGVLRVAGLKTLSDEAQQSERRLDTFHRSLMDSLASRWGVTVEYITTDTPEQAMELVTSGQADIAVGVQPDWTWADRVDFTQPYLLHGYRLMVKQNSGIFGFAELRGGRTVATVFSEPEADNDAVVAAEKVNSLIRTANTNEDSLSIFILEQDNAHVAFADSLILLPHIEAYPNDFQLTKDWYSERVMAMAVPRNDIDFRLLIDYTLQELVRDGTLQRLWQPVLPAGETIEFDIWPGPREYLGFQLGRS